MQWGVPGAWGVGHGAGQGRAGQGRQAGQGNARTQKSPGNAGQWERKKTRTRRVWSMSYYQGQYRHDTKRNHVD